MTDEQDVHRSSELRIQSAPLEDAERRKLRRSAYFVWFFAGSMAALFVYFFWILDVVSPPMRVPLGIFSFFFLGILALIIVAQTRTAFQTEKTMYTGVLEEKYTEAARGTDTQLQEYCYFRVSGRRFGVPLGLFQRFSVGSVVTLHCTLGDRVFNVTTTERVQDHQSVKARISAFPIAGSVERMTDEQRRQIARAFWKAFLVRGCMVGVLFRYLVVVLWVFVLLITSISQEWVPTVYGALVIGLILAWVLLNRKTFRLFLDWQGGEVRVWEESILDRLESTHLKPGPRSIVTTRYRQTGENRYFYLQTTRFWLRVDRELYEAKKTGERIYISGSPRQKLIFSIHP